jgi:hypothetical protein
MIAFDIFGIPFGSLPFLFQVPFMSCFVESNQLELLNNDVREERYLPFRENLANNSTKNSSLLEQRTDFTVT